jgi:mRNA-degrading endonuclease RelE of RelBE toxin-antitoxin system
LLSVVAMSFEIEFTQVAADHVRAYRKFDQQLILDAIAEQLTHEPATETRHRKRLGENEMSDWELRVQKFRVFYDVILEEKRQTVKIKAVGHKEHNTLFIGGREVKL